MSLWWPFVTVMQVEVVRKWGDLNHPRVHSSYSCSWDHAVSEERSSAFMMLWSTCFLLCGDYSLLTGVFLYWWLSIWDEKAEDLRDL